MKNRQNKSKNMVRILCLFLAGLMVVGLFAGVMGTLQTMAATSQPVFEFENLVYAAGTSPGYVPAGKRVDVGFYIYDENIKLKDENGNDTTESITLKSNALGFRGVWNEHGSNIGTKLTIDPAGDKTYYAVLSGISYKSASDRETLRFYIKQDDANSRLGIDAQYPISVNIPSSYFEKPDPGETAEPEKYEAKIVIENVFVQDKEGNHIAHVDEDTEPFSIRVVYRDYGLEKYYQDNIPDKSISGYITNTGGFIPRSSLYGEVRKLVASRDNIPRFSMVFRNLEFEKDGSNEITAKVIYDLDGDFPDADMTIQVKQAKTLPEDEEDEKDKLSPIKPHVIADYSYGKDEIVAGEDFTLNLHLRNTSADIPLESVVMKVTPSEDLSIAQSDVAHFPTLGAGGRISHSMVIGSKPGADVGNAEVSVEFTFQYVDTVNKKREESTDTQKIGIPITQIDRFTVDPITEMSDYATVGEPFYVTVSLVNRGKTPTYNISAAAKSNMKIISASEHFGNLEPGKTDTLEVAITAEEPGEMVGEIVVQYEDENTNEHEITQSFSLHIEEPYVPDFDPSEMEGDMEQEPEKPPTSMIVLVVLGSLLLAAPFAYYLIKRRAKKESEGFDADF